MKQLIQTFVESVQAFIQQWTLDQQKPQPIRVEVEEQRRQQMQRRRR
ncbi:hypothetical protein HF888_13185 [Bermanella marisrubri]|uniref:Uncharacterized protein n=1 Tax=Bermanella marisrubri TaxID=207949 RepID=Q1MY98_9GAMM|nr:hypothetical protein [Bermanella marisrubri]EAT10969.1 hypothetical protein RED65_03100 [Oceanobacter sp. RED65] [Bermanella marisrubri]QIZ85116.1 hypothetical protein HF888_13185 [Bermanella marisrubri]